MIFSSGQPHNNFITAAWPPDLPSPQPPPPSYQCSHLRPVPPTPGWGHQRWHYDLQPGPVSPTFVYLSNPTSRHPLYTLPSSLYMTSKALLLTPEFSIKPATTWARKSWVTKFLPLFHLLLQRFPSFCPLATHTPYCRVSFRSLQTTLLYRASSQWVQYSSG